MTQVHLLFVCPTSPHSPHVHVMAIHAGVMAYILGVNYIITADDTHSCKVKVYVLWYSQSHTLSKCKLINTLHGIEYSWFIHRGCISFALLSGTLATTTCCPLLSPTCDTLNSAPNTTHTLGAVLLWHCAVQSAVEWLSISACPVLWWRWTSTAIRFWAKTNISKSERCKLRSGCSFHADLAAAAYMQAMSQNGWSRRAWAHQPAPRSLPTSGRPCALLNLQDLLAEYKGEPCMRRNR